MADRHAENSGDARCDHRARLLGDGEGVMDRWAKSDNSIYWSDYFTQPDDYDWKMWRFSLYKICRRNGLAQFAENYLYEVKRYNYLYSPILMSMRFYLMGIEEWLSYPNPGEIEIFRQERSIHWAKNLPGGKRITRLEIIAESQDIAYQYRRAPEEARVISTSVLDEFCTATLDLTNKHVSKKRIIIDGKAVKNA